jgi:hypothetical protein
MSVKITPNMVIRNLVSLRNVPVLYYIYLNVLQRHCTTFLDESPC